MRGGYVKVRVAGGEEVNVRAKQCELLGDGEEELKELKELAAPAEDEGGFDDDDDRLDEEPEEAEKEEKEEEDDDDDEVAAAGSAAPFSRPLSI